MAAFTAIVGRSAYPDLARPFLLSAKKMTTRIAVIEGAFQPTEDGYSLLRLRQALTHDIDLAIGISLGRGKAVTLSDPDG